MDWTGSPHNILELILRHILDSKFQAETISPKVNYGFFEHVLDHFEELKKWYRGQEVLDWSKNFGWRDGFEFLFELCESHIVRRTIITRPMETGLISIGEH